MSHIKKKILGKGAALVVLSAFVPNPFMVSDALAQPTSNTNLVVKASIVNPLGIKEGVSLNFGIFANSATAGKLTFNNAGTTISNGILITTGTVGKVTFTAPKDAVFTISIPDLAGTNAITLAIGGATPTTKTMKITQMTLDVISKMEFTAAATAATFKNAKATRTAKVNDAAGVGKATIGGILNFKPTNIVGAYTTTYVMSITF